MKLILHHALKDLRGLRGPIGLWLAVLLTDAAAQALKVDRFVSDPTQLDRLMTALPAAGMALLAFGWLIAAMVVQADSLDSPSAFWLTRPLSPRALLGSKLLVLLPLFLVVPAAAAGSVAAANGVEGRLLLRLILERLAVDGALLLPVLVAASVRHNLARTVLFLTAGVLIYGLIHAVAMLRPPFLAFASGAEYMMARSSGVLVAMALSVVGSLVLLVHQYLTRATKRTVWLAAGMLALTVAAGDFWRWNLIPDSRPPEVDTRVFNPAGVRLLMRPGALRRGDAMPASYSWWAGASAGRGPRVELRGFLRAAGVPPGWVVRVLQGEGELRLAGRATAGRTYAVFTGETPYSRQYPGASLAGDVKAAFESVLHARVLNSARSVDAISVHLLALPEANFQAEQGMTASYRGRVELEALRLVLGPPLPLRPGASTRFNGEGLTIVDAPLNAEHIATVRIAQAQVRTAPLPSNFLVVRNRRTGESFIPLAMGGSRNPFGLLPNDLRVTRMLLDVPPTAAPIDARWLADAELMMATLGSAGTFTKPLVLEEFVLPQMYYYRQ